MTISQLKPCCVGQRLSELAARMPDQAAVVHDETSLTYMQLNYWSEQFARRLVGMGMKQGERVCVMTYKDVRLLIAIYGCFKAGAVFVPLDAGNPDTRLKYILDSAQPCAVVAPVEAGERLASLTPELKHIPSEELLAHAHTEQWSTQMHMSPAIALPAVSLDAPAYCMFTSGSTGSPKGVVIRHDSLVAFFEAANAHMSLNESSKCLNLAPFFFDAVVVDTFYPLYRGATVYLYDGLILPTTVLGMVEEEGITQFTAVAPILTMIADSGTMDDYNLNSVKTIWTGADVLNVKATQQWLSRIPGLKIVNGYGPTEATCACLAYPITELEPDRVEPYPIGKPLAGIHIRIVDEHLQPLPQGEAGELLVSGIQILDAYWDNAEETRKRIVSMSGLQYYRTGDICYLDHSGNVHYIGRADDEIKIRGRRINLNEIRQALFAQSIVLDATIFVVEDDIHGKLLTVVAEVDVPLTEAVGEAVLIGLEKQLPSYMVPRRLVLTKQLPKLPSDKTDKQKLIKFVQSSKMNNSGILIYAE
ncbi:amino acid adenylation domain-containing protein [Paenibacillus taiwanensis]|uniref:amino acid adenylation domain-containing protein n=1 Tax=Paenibacillus taiwanensis TaxID=401638 RepID=UPI00042971B6|nr:amino acid adenylation domain-containing protein [Paenibacillus taiwanensis]